MTQAQRVGHVPANAHEDDVNRIHHLAIERPNQVWAIDVTCVPMKRGFVYLCAAIDWTITARVKVVVA